MTVEKEVGSWPFDVVAGCSLIDDAVGVVAGISAVRTGSDLTEFEE